MKQRNDIQGLRAVAVLLVILAHLEVPGFAGGWIGVDVFFVISGYLITSLLMREYDGTNHVSLLQFYVRRAKRILPAALTTIAVVVVAGYLLLNEIRAANIRTDAVWSLGFASNFRFISLSTDYFARSTAVSPLQHFWSLAVEEQFYLIWPALFLLLARQHGLRFAGREITRPVRIFIIGGGLTLLSLLWSISYTASNPAGAYFSTATRVWELGFGVLLAVGLPLITTTEKVRRLCSWGGLAAILLGSCLIIKPGDPFPGYLALIPVLGAVGILLAGSTDKLPLPNRILATPPLVFIGTISFSLYLWHWPVHVFYDALHPDTVTTAAGIGIQAGIILALSLASYYLIENPTRHATWGVREPVYRRFDEIDLVPRGAATILCVGALLLFVVSSNVSSTRATDAANLDPAVVAENGDITDGSDVTRTIVPRDPQTVLTEWSTKVTDGLGVTKLPSDLQKTITNLSKQAVFEPCSSVAVGCVVNRPGATRTVAVFGDSHAAMLLSTIRAVFPNWNIHQYAYRLCVTASFPDRFDGKDEEQQQGCAEFRTKAIADLVANPPDVLIMSDSLAWVEPNGSIDQWKETQKVTYDLLQPIASKTTIVHLTPVPGTVDNAWEKCLGADGSITRCFSRASKVAAVTAAQAEVVQQTPWIKIMDIFPLLCDGDSCPPVIAGVPTYSDGNHFSIQFRQAVAPAFGSILLQTVPSLAGQVANS